MKVQIVSHFNGKSWEGMLPAEFAVEGGFLEGAFRCFNRVDEADVTRLERLGYELPSMTAGDLVQISDQWYLCADMGWEKLTDWQATQYWARSLDAEKSGDYPPRVRGLDEEGALVVLTRTGEERIPASGGTELVERREYG